MQRRFLANLHALEARYGALFAHQVAEPISKLSIQMDKQTGAPLKVTGPGFDILLTDPAAPSDHIREMIDGPIRNGQAVLCSGLGNALTLEAVLANHPKLYHDILSPVYVVELRPEVLAACLYLRDWAELIHAENVFFFIGPDAVKQLEAFLLKSPGRALPGVVLNTSTAVNIQCQAMVDRLVALRTSQLAQLRDKVDAYYRPIPPKRFAALFDENPPRPPRVLFFTTLFSTVLQFSTRDLALAFEQLGWVTQTYIERDRSDRPSLMGLGLQLADFKPDAVVQIDHARFEWLHEIVPDQLPFITWIQDTMPQLYISGAGDKLLPTDIVFSVSAPCELESCYGYPSDRTFFMPMVVNPHTFSGTPVEHTVDAMAYVSHTSKTPEMVLDEYRDDILAPVPEKLTGPMIAALNWIIAPAQETFQQGQPILFDFQWQDLLDHAMEKQGFALKNPDLRKHFASFLHLKLGNAMFRHQMLSWAANLHDCPLKLYGQGWDLHPEFSPYAQGPVEHGKQLAELYQTTAINLQAVISSNVHQRVFEGVWSGGFFLMRYHPLDFAPCVVAQLQPWLADHRGKPVPELLASDDLAEEQRLILTFVFRRWLAQFENLTDRAIALLQRYGRLKGLPGFLGDAIHDVYFRTADEFAERVAYYRTHPNERIKVVTSMQKHLKQWNMADVLGRRLNDVSRYLAGLDDHAVA